MANEVIKNLLRRDHMSLALHAAANPYLSGYSPESHCSVCKHSKHPPSGARTPGDLECLLSGLQRVQEVFLKLRQANGFINDGTVVCQFEKE